MRRTIGLAMVVALLAGTVGCNGKKVAVVTEPEVLSGMDLEYHWTLDLHLPEGVKLDKMWQLDGEVYCLSTDNVLFCVDAEVGHVRWSLVLPDVHTNVFPPSHYDGMLLTDEPLTLRQIKDPTLVGRLDPFNAVVINTLSKLLVIDRESQGEPKVYRNIELEFASNTGATTDGESAFIGSTDGLCHAIMLGAGVHRWDLDVRTQIKARPEVGLGRVYVAGTAQTNNTFYAVRSLAEYEEMWSQPLPGPVAADFHVDQRGAFIPVKRNLLVAFELASGKPLWPAIPMEGFLTTPVQVASQSVFQYANMDKLYAIDIVDGSIRWTMEEGRRVLAVMDGKVYLLDASDNLRIVNEIMGTPEGSLPLSGFDLFVPNTTTPAIFTGTRDGRIFCISPTGQASITDAG